MEKQGYRENLEMLREAFPGRATITPQEASELMDVNIKTVYSAISRVKKPIPAIPLSRKKIVIPITAFARWLSVDS